MAKDFKMDVARVWISGDCVCLHNKDISEGIERLFFNMHESEEITITKEKMTLEEIEKYCKKGKEL